MIPIKMKEYIADRLSKHWQRNIQIELRDLLGGSKRSEVYRCSVQGAYGQIPSSIIIKFYVPTESESDTDAHERIRQGFASEWTGLDFLTFHEHVNISPKVVLGDKEHAFVVLEDLGDVVQLDHILQDNDPELAEKSLIELAKTLATMHGATLGEQEAFFDRHSVLTSVNPINTTRLWDKFAEHFSYLEKSLSMQIPQGVYHEINETKTFFEAGNPLYAYSHGDPCPDNCVWQKDKVKLIDFERGSFRHAFLDAVYGRMHFPTCWCVGSIPQKVYTKMEHAYREKLSEYYPQIMDDQLFQKEITVACAWYMAKSIKEGIFENDKTWGLATIRQRMLTRFKMFSKVSEEYGYMRATGLFVSKMTSTLEQEWTLGDFQPLKPYPAFSDVC